jgi:hypothetical protein
MCLRRFVTTSTWAALAAAVIFTAGYGSVNQGVDSRAQGAQAIPQLVDRSLPATRRNAIAAYLKLYGPKVAPARSWTPTALNRQASRAL